jgi:N4-gp56 family major capsid protein
MAETSAASGLTVQQWDDQFFTDSLNANQFRSFMGMGKNSLIQMKETLTKEPGDSVTFGLVNALKNAAITGSNTLEGNEEQLITRSQKLIIDQYRNAVRIPVLQNQFSSIDLRNAAKDALLEWEMELVRNQIITALGSINGVAYASASEAQKDAWITDNSDRVLFGATTSNLSAGDHSASLASIDNTADQLTPEAISLMKRMAKGASPKIGPLKPRTQRSRSDAYVLFAGSLSLRDLKEDSVFMQANREARERGKGNPLFEDADYVWDNVAIIEIEDIAVISGVGASSIDVAPVYLCGRQALGFALAKRPETIEDEFDYKDKQGCAIRQWHEIDKLRFGTGVADTADLKQHGVVTGYFAAVAD